MALLLISLLIGCGSGNFRQLMVVSTEGDERRVWGGVFAGDRVKIQEFGIDEDVMVVQMVVHASDDAMCCPTLQVRDRYSLQGGKLV